MFEQRIQMEEGQTLTLVEMTRNVVVTGWDDADVLLRLREGQEEDLVVEKTETGPAVSARRSCEVRVPPGVPVVVRQALGNFKANGLGDLNVEQAHGNMKLGEVSEAVVAEVYGNMKVDATASLRVVGTVHGSASLKAVQGADLQNVRGNLQASALDRLRVSRINGNLNVKEIEGTLDVDQVGGNVLLNSIGGAVTLDQVAGNATARYLAGGAIMPKIGGNLILNGELGVGCTYHFHVRGNAVLRLSEDASAHLTLSAGGKLMSSVELNDEVREGQRLSGSLGDGGAEIAIEAGGNIMLGGGGTVIRIELGDEISRQVEESLAAVDLESIGRHVSDEVESAMARLQVKMEGMDWERIGLQSQRAVERAMEKMQRNMDRMVEKAARQQERLERRAEKAARRLERLEIRHPGAARRQQDWPGENVAAPPEPEPNLDEERLSILKMVEQGQITPEDAEMLLDALH